jgi:hypothetical protein
VVLLLALLMIQILTHETQILTRQTQIQTQHSARMLL